ncbi:MAG TPA: TIGR03905 family TSCPD domain-containing protein [Clostridia bacterium]|nr:TIGR03905 family TSCPD domain-containing protein [Clostridia bacterium]
MHYRYKTNGVCSSFIDIDVNENIIENITFLGGCQGNALGLSSLLKGMNVNDVIKKLEGTRCGYKKTSCPDQLAKALLEMLNENN